MTLPVVVIPLYERPMRMALSIHRVMGAEQLRTLADFLHQHLHDLAPIVEILKRAGWEFVAQETMLVFRHPSVRTPAMAEVALCQLGIESQWYRIHDTPAWERLFPTPADPLGPRSVSLSPVDETRPRDTVRQPC